MGRNCNFLKRLLHEVLGCAPAVILAIFFCKVKIFPLLEELPLYNYSATVSPKYEKLPQNFQSC
jgi:hypothetical protein